MCSWSEIIFSFLHVLIHVLIEYIMYIVMLFLTCLIIFCCVFQQYLLAKSECAEIKHSINPNQQHLSV